jgi:hypothetical protein
MEYESLQPYAVHIMLNLRWKVANEASDYFSSCVGIGRFCQVRLEITVMWILV